MGDTLALFDLDHTLLTGDSDTLWCDFLVARGLLGPDFAERNAALAAGYRAGTVGVEAFCRFYAGTLAGRAPADWAPLLQDFLGEVLRPRIPAAAQALVQQHRAQGHRLLLTSATNRVLAAPSAAELGFAELLATELALDGAGRFTGELLGTPTCAKARWPGCRPGWPGRAWRRTRPSRPWPGPGSTATRSTTCRCCWPWATRWRWTRPPPGPGGRPARLAGADPGARCPRP
jgi:phosphoserine phosphatase